VVARGDRARPPFDRPGLPGGARSDLRVGAAQSAPQVGRGRMHRAPHLAGSGGGSSSFGGGAGQVPKQPWAHCVARSRLCGENFELLGVVTD